MAKSLTVNGETFRTKDSLIAHIRAMLARYRDGQQLDMFDQAFMLDLLKLHPHHDQKVGCGVSHVFVDSNPIYPGNRSRGFYLVRHDGSRTDFSYKECLSPSSDDNKVFAAMRVAIEPDILAFKNRIFGTASTVRCPVTGEQLTFTTAHVDHRSPKTFQNLVMMFLRQEGKELADVEVDETSTYDMMFQDRLADRQLEQRWCMFHNDHADLEVVSKTANLSVRRRTA